MCLSSGYFASHYRVAPKGIRPVVHHTAVLGYVGPLSDRDAFAETVRQSCGVWISKELASVFPEIAGNAQPSQVRMKLPLASPISVSGNSRTLTMRPDSVVSRKKSEPLTASPFKC